MLAVIATLRHVNGLLAEKIPQDKSDMPISASAVINYEVPTCTQYTSYGHVFLLSMLSTSYLLV